ncbi:MAG: NTP transferase domain-containing protein [Oscillospiraceae bacterium]|nr:NTP transferase domain-containing protein [Oscillospiraceae bacterium]
MKNKISIKNGVVTKVFGSVIACDKEKYILALLQGTGLVPRLTGSEKLTVHMEYTDGLTLSQAIEKTPRQLPHILEKLIDTLIKFNDYTEDVVLDDINLKNFIYSPGTDTVTAIDFESWHRGDSTCNLAAAKAMIETAFLTDSKAEKLARHMADYICRKTDIRPQRLQELSAAEKQKILTRRRAMPRIRRADCVILAGGKSSRMGSDKGLLKLGDYTFTDWLIYTAQLFDNLYISANKDDYLPFGYPVIADIHRDKGPLGAFHACLQAAGKEFVFFMPCDSPFITESTVVEFFSKADLSADCNIPRCNGRIYPATGLYSKSVLPLVQCHIEQDNLRLMSLADRLNTHYVDLSSPDRLRNINTTEDYKTLHL